MVRALGSERGENIYPVVELYPASDMVELGVHLHRVLIWSWRMYSFSLAPPAPSRSQFAGSVRGNFTHCLGIILNNK